MNSERAIEGSSKDDARPAPERARAHLKRLAVALDTQLQAVVCREVQVERLGARATEAAALGSRDGRRRVTHACATAGEQEGLCVCVCVFV